MIFGKSKLELKVGVFVFFGLIILIMFVLMIGNFRTWSLGYRVNVIFNFINGVKVGAPVRFAGVDVGEVKSINIVFVDSQPLSKVRVTCWVKNVVKIPADSTVWVNTLGLLGEKYVEIMPGKDYKNVLAENQSLDGNDPIAMHEVAALAKNLVGDLDASFVKIKNGEGTIGKLLSDETIYNELEATMKDIRRNPWKLFWKTKEKPVK
ncbi:MAG: MlaD family protein [Candidatus Omnitrophica bacterium]|nr:MlaD family protein [Candidatus Omnitrophota bacterium]